MNIIYESRKFIRFEEQSIFEPDKFIEVSEDYFDNVVVKYRDMYKISYCGNYQEFTDINTGLKIRRYYS